MKVSTLVVVATCAMLLSPGFRAVAQDAPAADGKPTIFVCGDSTAKNNTRARSGEQLAGWGTTIPEFFDADKVTINNVAIAGRSSLSYYEGAWPNVLPQIKAGDYVLLVFGINDGSTPNGIGDEVRAGRGGREQHTYGWYMSKMATDARDKGAHVYFLTVTTRNMWTNPKVVFDDATPRGPLPADYDPQEDRIERGTGNGRYTQWTKDVAAKLNLPVFDLTNYCADVYEAMGREEVDKFYNDHNHTFVPGARKVAECIVAGLKAFPDSPFIPMLSEEGKKVTPADPKFIAENKPGSTTLPAETAM